MKEFVDSTAIPRDTELLLERMRKDAYLYFRHLVGDERVGDVRYQYIGDEISIWQTKPPFPPYAIKNWNEYTGAWSDRNLIAVPSRAQLPDRPETLTQALPENCNCCIF